MFMNWIFIYIFYKKKKKQNPSKYLNTESSYLSSYLFFKNKILFIFSDKSLPRIGGD